MQFTILFLASAAVAFLNVTAVPIHSNSTTYGFTTPSKCTFVSKSKAKPICQDCMSCTAKQQGILLGYNLHIGAPYADGVGCEPIKKSLEEASGVPDISKYRCRDDGFDDTKISFRAWDYNQG